MKNTILILGDSWGCGEWKNQMWAQEFGIDHAGLAQYLTDDGHRVINLSQPGGSNFITWQRLDSFLLSNPYVHDTIEKIFVFQTEWDRDLMLDKVSLLGSTANQSAIFNNIGFAYVEAEKNLYDQIKIDTANGLSTLLLLNFYQQLSRIATLYNVQVELIGGCSDVLPHQYVESKFPNVKIACQSLTNLLLNDNPNLEAETVTSLYLNIEIVEFIKHNLSNNEELNALLYQIALADKRQDDWRINTDWFWPDHHHANRTGHRKLYDFLRENW